MTVKDFPDSIKAILYDRIVSPLSGTFIFSWLVWNWKLVYFFFVFDGTYTIVGKIDYISTHYNNWGNLFWLPFASTIFLIGFYPIVSTGAYWVHLKYKMLQNDIKNKIENNKLLTIEQSLKIKREYKDLYDSFLELEKSKDDELKWLKEDNKQKADKLIEVTNENEGLKNRIDVELREKALKEKKVVSSIDGFISENERLEENKIIKILNDIDKKEYNLFFERLMTDIANEDYCDTSNYTDKYNYFLNLEIIKVTERNSTYDSLRKFQFTPFGKRIKDSFVIKKLNL